MKLSPELKKAYTQEHLSAKEAQLRARLIAWGPAAFQATRIMLERGVFELLREAPDGLTRGEICQSTGLSDYAVKCLLEASLCLGTVTVNLETDRFVLAKTGWFLLIDPATKADISFNHDVNYEGWFHLEESLVSGKPEGLKHFGDWPTLYEAFSSLPDRVRESWCGFDHFYSDHSFSEALGIVFGKDRPATLYDVGGNTGRWALRCVAYDPEVRVTVLDLPQQIGMMKEAVKDAPGAERIEGYGVDLLDPDQSFPEGRKADAIWMSQFLDCFSKEEITTILRRAVSAMGQHSRLYIMETLWDRQKYEPAALALTMTSLYFTAIANGNSKMYSTEDLLDCIRDSGLRIETVHDGLGHGHTILVCTLDGTQEGI